MDNYLKFSKKDAEIWLKGWYPLTVVMDRYGGCYSGGMYIAYPCEFYEVDEAVGGDDVECMVFWDGFRGVVGRGASSGEAIGDLCSKMKEIIES